MLVTPHFLACITRRKLLYLQVLLRIEREQLSRGLVLPLRSKNNNVHWVDLEATTLKFEPKSPLLNPQVTYNQLQSCLSCASVP